MSAKGPCSDGAGHGPLRRSSSFARSLWSAFRVNSNSSRIALAAHPAHALDVVLIAPVLAHTQEQHQPCHGQSPPFHSVSNSPIWPSTGPHSSSSEAFRAPRPRVLSVFTR